MLLRRLLLTTLLGLVACASSEDACEGPDCACDGEACCVGWLQPSDEGTCEARAWPPTQRHRLAEPGADAIEVSVDGLGRALVGWQRRISQDPFARSVLAEQTGHGWQLHTLGPATAGAGTRVTLASRGLEVWATWSQLRTEDGEARGVVRLLQRDASGSWTTSDRGEAVSTGSKAFEPRPLLPASGEGLLVWNQWREDGGYGVAIAKMARGTSTLERPTSSRDVLSPLVFFVNAPQIAVGRNGDAIVTWYQATPPAGSTEPNAPSAGLRLFVSERFRTHGTFSRPAVEDWISPEGPPLASHAVRNPVVAVGHVGQALVLWSQEHPSGATGLFLASRDGLGEWTTPEDIDDTFGPLREDASCIEVAFSPAGEAHVTWFDGPPGATTVYTARRGTGDIWDDPLSTPISTDGRVAQDPRLAVGPDGEAVVVWSERGGDNRWRVMGRRRGPEASAWGTAVELSEPSEGDALGPAVAIGPDGTLVVAWGVGPIGAQTVSVAVLP